MSVTPHLENKMMTISELFKMELRPSEIIVTAVQHRDYIVAITNHGTVYKITGEEYHVQNIEHGPKMD